MVIAARSRARTGSHERVDQLHGDLLKAVHFLLDQKGIEQAERLFFRPEALPQAHACVRGIVGFRSRAGCGSRSISVS